MELSLSNSDFLKIQVTFSDAIGDITNMALVFQDILNVESLDKLHDILNSSGNSFSGKLIKDYYFFGI